MLALTVLSLTFSLQPVVRGPSAQARRDVLALGVGALGLALPHAAWAANPFDKGELKGLKPEVVCKPKGTCACNCMPDGFGGYKERTEEVKPVASKVLDAFGDEVDGPSPVAKPKASIGLAPPTGYNSAKSSAASSTPALSFEELVANSVSSKEEMYGRKLTDAEVSEIRVKVSKFATK
jgi:hypothetical protein